MSAPAESILPASYFEGLSNLWSGCAYVGSAIVAAGLIFQTVNNRPNPTNFLWLLAKVSFIAITTVFLREWLMRLNDIVIAFGSMLGVDPTKVDEQFIQFIAGKTGSDPKTSVWDIIWGTKSVGTAVCYALLWLFGWLSWGVQYVVKLIGDILLTTGWSISPIFVAFFMLRPMAGVAQKYVVGLVALVLWPFGWVIASVVTKAMLDAASSVSLLPVFISGDPIAVPALTVLLIGTWMLVSSVLAPWISTKILLMGVNPGIALAQGVGGVAGAATTASLGAAVAAVTGGAGAAGIAAAAAAGGLVGGAESTVRGGDPAKTTGSAIRGLSGIYAGGYMRRNTEAAEQSAAAGGRRADAAESIASTLARHARRKTSSRSGNDHQPHEDNPNQAAIDI